MRARARWSLGLIALAAALLAGGCGDEGPSGPGEVEGSVTAEASVALGGAVMTLAGPGIRELLPDGDTRVFSAPAGGDSLRVVLVSTGEAGGLRFRIAVDDVGAPPPAATVLEAVDTENAPLTSLAGVEVRFSR